MKKVLDKREAEEIKKNLRVPGGNGNKPKEPSLVDLDSLKITVDPEKEEQARRKAIARKEYAEKAGKKIVNLRHRLRQLQLIKNVGVLTPEQEVEFQKVEKTELMILEGCDAELKKHTLFRVFVEEICTSKRDRGIINNILISAIRKGWYRLATMNEKTAGWHTREWPEGTILGFNHAVYFLNPVLPKAFSDDLFAAFDKAIKETVAAEEAYECKEIVRLKTAGNTDLSKLQSGAAGDYAIIFPGGNRIKEGAGIVSVRQNEIVEGKKPIWTITIVDGAGSLAWFRENKGKFIPYAWTFKGIPEKVSDDKRMLAEELIAAINTAVRFQRRKKEEKNKF